MDTKDANTMDTDVQTIDPREVDASLRSSEGLGLLGFENVSARDIALPTVRLIQPGSSSTELLDGSEAPAGQFYFDNSQAVQPELRLAIISLKIGDATFTDDNGNDVTKRRGAVLAVERGRDEIILVRFSAASLQALGRMMAQMKSLKLAAAWEREVIVTSEKIESTVNGQKVKYYAAKFRVGDGVTTAESEQYNLVYEDYKDYFGREDLAGGEAA